MKRYVKPCSIDISVTAQCSKSYSQRALIAALLAGGESVLMGFTPCDDSLAAIEVIRQLGATVVFYDDRCVVRSSFDMERYSPHTIHCGESGLLSRIVIAVMSLYDRHTTITGEGTLLNRSFEAMERPLRELGAEITFNNSHLPAHIKWGMKGGETSIDGSGGSQTLTALLMTLPLTARGGELFVLDLSSRPYIDMTIELMAAFGVSVERDGYDKFTIKGNSKYHCTTYNIEGDWSSVSTLLVAGAIAGEVTITNLNMESLQADKKIIDLLMMAGVTTIIGQSRITTRKSRIEKFCFDATHCPDLIPAAVALAAAADGTCVIIGASRLTNKESNRAQTLQMEYAKIGIKINLEDDALIITPSTITGGEVFSHGDHRIAMSLAVIALISENGITIDGAEAVSKSFPDFWETIYKSYNH